MQATINKVNERTYSFKECADFLGIHYNTFRRNLKNKYYGDINVIKVSPRKSRILHSDLTAIKYGKLPSH